MCKIRRWGGLAVLITILGCSENSELSSTENGGSSVQEEILSDNRNTEVEEGITGREGAGCSNWDSSEETTRTLEEGLTATAEEGLTGASAGAKTTGDSTNGRTTVGRTGLVPGGTPGPWPLSNATYTASQGILESPVI